MSTATRTETLTTPKRRANRVHPPGGSALGPTRRPVQAAPYVLLAPFVLLFVCFFLYPSISSVIAAFQTSPREGRQWAAFSNFAQAFHDPLFIAAAGNTAFFIVVSVIVIFPVSLGLALLIRPLWVRGQAIFKVLLVAPAVVAPVVSTVVFQTIFGSYGLLNSALRGIFPDYENIDWFNDPTWARWTVALIFVWRWTGFTMIYFVAGLATVSRELEEAAKVDGASAWQRLWHVIWPQLQPIRILVVILVVQGSAQIFDEPQIISGDGTGPGNTLISMTMYVFSAGFGQGRFGVANAAALILLVVMLVVSAAIIAAGRDNTQPRRKQR